MRLVVRSTKLHSTMCLRSVGTLDCNGSIVRVLAFKYLFHYAVIPLVCVESVRKRAVLIFGTHDLLPVFQSIGTVCVAELLEHLVIYHVFSISGVALAILPRLSTRRSAHSNPIWRENGLRALSTKSLAVPLPQNS